MKKVLAKHGNMCYTCKWTFEKIPKKGGYYCEG